MKGRCKGRCEKGKKRAAESGAVEPALGGLSKGETGQPAPVCYR